MKIDKQNNLIEVSGIKFKYEIIEAFSEGSAKCLTISKLNEGLEKMSLTLPIFKKVMDEVKNSEFFQEEVDVNALMFLEYKKFIGKGNSFIMSDLAKI